MQRTDSEIEKAKDLKRLGLNQYWIPRRGQILWARQCPEGCFALEQPNLFVIQEIRAILRDDHLWLPSFDDLLDVTRELKISFSQITDFLHRRRFADVNEREGLMQLLIENLRSKAK